MVQEPPSEGTRGHSAESPSPTHTPAAVQSLKKAMRRARFDDAERVGVIADLRAVRLGRLEVLADALQPLIAQIPDDVDLFDIGLMPGVNPRLFIDMIGFVEMGRDARLYRFLQDTRHGRLLIAESEDVDKLVESVTDYVARRLVERDKALAAEPDGALGAACAKASWTPQSGPRPGVAVSRELPDGALSGGRRGARIAGNIFAFVIDLLGSITFLTILVVLGCFIWKRMQGRL